MHDPFRMRGCETFRHLTSQLDDLFVAESALACIQVLERGALQHLHRHERRAFALTNFKDRGYVVMMNGGHCPCFAKESTSTVWRRRDLLIHHLERDGAFEFVVLRTKHITHSPFAELVDHPIVTELTQVTGFVWRFEKRIRLHSCGNRGETQLDQERNRKGLDPNGTNLGCGCEPRTLAVGLRRILSTSSRPTASV